MCVCVCVCVYYLRVYHCVCVDLYRSIHSFNAYVYHTRSLTPWTTDGNAPQSEIVPAIWIHRVATRLDSLPSNSRQSSVCGYYVEASGIRLDHHHHVGSRSQQPQLDPALHETTTISCRSRRYGVCGCSLFGCNTVSCRMSGIIVVMVHVCFIG